MYYHTCPLCGANLDPGERCDCLERKKREPERSGNRRIPINKNSASVKQTDARGLTPIKI